MKPLSTGGRGGLEKSDERRKQKLGKKTEKTKRVARRNQGFFQAVEVIRNTKAGSKNLVLSLSVIMIRSFVELLVPKWTLVRPIPWPCLSLF